MNTHFIFTIHLPNRYKTHSFLATLLTFKCSDMVTHVSLSALGWTHIPALNNYFSWSLHTAALQWENKKPKNKIWNQPCAVTCANKIERNVQHLPRDVVIKRWLAWNILKLQYKRSFECFLITFRDLVHVIKSLSHDSSFNSARVRSLWEKWLDTWTEAVLTQLLFLSVRVHLVLRRLPQRLSDQRAENWSHLSLRQLPRGPDGGHQEVRKHNLHVTDYAEMCSSLTCMQPSFIDSPEEMGISDVFRQLVAKCLKIQFKIAICLWCVDTTLVHHLRRLFYARTIQRSVFSGKRMMGQEDCDENEWNSSCCLKKHVEAKLKYTSGLHSSVLYCSVAVCQFGQMRAVSEDHLCVCVGLCVQAGGGQQPASRSGRPVHAGPELRRRQGRHGGAAVGAHCSGCGDRHTRRYIDLCVCVL